MRIIRIWAHVSRETSGDRQNFDTSMVSRETWGDRQNFDTSMVSRETLQKRPKSLFLQGFLARGRQCESDAQTLWVAEAIENVCVRMSSLPQAWADLH